jgi:hypothetical protein
MTPCVPKSDVRAPASGPKGMQLSIFLAGGVVIFRKALSWCIRPRVRSVQCLAATRARHRRYLRSDPGWPLIFRYNGHRRSSNNQHLTVRQQVDQDRIAIVAFYRRVLDDIKAHRAGQSGTAVT